MSIYNVLNTVLAQISITKIKLCMYTQLYAVMYNTNIFYLKKAQLQHLSNFLDGNLKFSS